MENPTAMVQFLHFKAINLNLYLYQVMILCSVSLKETLNSYTPKQKAIFSNL